MDFLRVLNMHPRDSKLEFFAGDHVYLIDGERSLGSVAGLIHQFAEELRPSDRAQDDLRA